MRRYRIETSLGDVLEIEVREEKDCYRVRVVGEDREYRVRIIGFDEDLRQAVLDIDGRRVRIDGFQSGVAINGVPALIRRIVEYIPVGISSKETGARRRVSQGLGKGVVAAPLSGRIIDVKVKPGDRVGVDTAVALIESMKMITEIKAGVEGVVEEIYVEPGKAVNKGQSIVKIKPLEEHGEKEAKGKKKKRG